MHPHRNQLLGALAPEDAAPVAQHLKRMPLASGDTLGRAGTDIAHVCFPEGGVVSIDDRLHDGTQVGLGIIGSEGLVGWPVLLGAGRSPYDATVAIGGATALSIEAGRLVDLCEARPRLKAALLGFVDTFMRQMGRTIASNLVDTVEGRLARWLLMNHDRIAGDEIALTHRQLGVMLGVRRASVTDALHIIEASGAIRATRGCVAIRNREQLRDMAGRCY